MLHNLTTVYRTHGTPMSSGCKHQLTHANQIQVERDEGESEATT